MTTPESAIEAWIEGIIDRVLRPIIREELRAVVEELAEPQQAPAEWLNTRATAKALGVHPKTVMRLARSGLIKHARAGRHLRFRRSDVNAYLERGA